MLHRCCRTRSIHPESGERRGCEIKHLLELARLQMRPRALNLTSTAPAGSSSIFFSMGNSSAALNGLAHRAAAVPDEGGEEAAGFSSHSGVVFGFTPLHDSPQEHGVSPQHQSCLL
ncbi:hypothetical protein EYF80_038933 [Liparis tanakae]|uniref:Uncharacterized protein n=1 Tax=Liparis tanakae TaxID=230148 RepID=A0A4Z2GC68_9TELE|nr:hypothetical protein EYF80_038933 [Liparis tanakae]